MSDRGEQREQEADDVQAVHSAPVAAGLNVVGLLLALFAAVGHLTAVQRFLGAWSDL